MVTLNYYLFPSVEHVDEVGSSIRRRPTGLADISINDIHES